MYVVHLQCPQTLRPKKDAKRGNGGNHLSRFENITLPSRLFDVGWLGFWKKLAMVRSEWRHRLGHILAQVFTTRPKVENADAALSMKTTKSEEKWQDDCACRLVPQFGASANGARLREMALGKSGNTGGIIRRQLQLQASAHRVCLVSLGRQTAIATCNLQ